MALRDRLLLRLCFLQDLDLYLLDANHRQAPSHLGSVHRHGAHRPRWSGVHVSDASAMQTAVILLDAGRHGSQHRGLLHRHEHHYHHDLHLQCVCGVM